MGGGSVGITVNGERREVPSGLLLDRFLRDLGHEPAAVAVEYNAVILRRGLFAETELRAGDRLEIVRFVQGG